MNGSRGSNFLHIYGASGTDPIFRQIFSFEVVASGMRSCNGESASCRRSYQCLDGMKTRLPEDLADQQGPQQGLRRNLGLLPTIPRILEIPSEAKTPCHIVEQMTWRRTAHFFFFLGFLRSSTSSCALAANTSRTAS